MNKKGGAVRGAAGVSTFVASWSGAVSNHMDLSEIRKTIEWMTPSDGWKVQKDATGDPANLWAEYGFSVLGALLIYGPKAAEVMEISDSLTPEESQEMEALGLLAQQKWEQGKREAKEKAAAAGA
tara:strand:+ start:270 stop:644 length:375 start_codon:yes stop_codon:yes gene_type:complete